MVHAIVEALRAIPPPVAIAAVLLLVAAETAMFLGFLIPGELVVILGGALAAGSRVPLAGILAAGILGPIAGDSIGYFVGRRYGRRFFRRHPARRWARARLFLRRHGESAVFVGRFTAFVRSISSSRGSCEEDAAGTSGARPCWGMAGNAEAIAPRT